MHSVMEFVFLNPGNLLGIRFLLKAKQWKDCQHNKPNAVGFAIFCLTLRGELFFV